MNEELQCEATCEWEEVSLAEQDAIANALETKPPDTNNKSVFQDLADLVRENAELKAKVTELENDLALKEAACVRMEREIEGLQSGDS